MEQCGVCGGWYAADRCYVCPAPSDMMLIPDAWGLLGWWWWIEVQRKTDKANE